MAHVRRWDLAINLVQRIVEALLFMHPAVWYISHRISVERENACDDLVLSSGWQPHDYVSALLRLAELCASSRGLPANSATLLAASGNRPSELKQRVLRLLGESPTDSPRMTHSGFGGVIVIILMMTAASTVLAMRPESKQPLQKPASIPESDSQTCGDELLTDATSSELSNRAARDSMMKALTRIEDDKATVLWTEVQIPIFANGIGGPLPSIVTS